MILYKAEIRETPAGTASQARPRSPLNKRGGSRIARGKRADKKGKQTPVKNMEKQAYLAYPKIESLFSLPV